VNVQITDLHKQQRASHVYQLRYTYFPMYFHKMLAVWRVYQTVSSLNVSPEKNTDCLINKVSYQTLSKDLLTSMKAKFILELLDFRRSSGFGALHAGIDLLYSYLFHHFLLRIWKQLISLILDFGHEISVKSYDTCESITYVLVPLCHLIFSALILLR